jgi:hypothetical protein
MSKVKSSTPILKTVAAFLMLMAAVALWGPQAARAQGQITGTGALLVDLDASTLTAGALASWENEGALGGAFTSSTANPVVEDVQGVRAVTFANTWLKSNFLTTADFTGGSDWSVELWAINPSVGGDEGMMTWSNRGEDNQNAACCYSTASGWGAFAGWGPGDIGYKDAIPPTAGIWHQITYTYVGGANSALTIYVDGKENTKGNKSLNIHGPGDNQAMPVMLGGSTGGDGNTGLAANVTEQWFTGSISKVRIHGGTLSATQVQANYDAEKASYLAAALTVTVPANGGGLYYGSVPTGSESVAQTVTIKNDGTSELTFTSPAASITGAAADQYNIVAGFDTTPLAPGATRSIQVTLKPTTAGFKAAQLVFNTNSAVTPAGVDLLGASGAPVALNTAGALLVDLKAAALPLGTLQTWANAGTLGGQFINTQGRYPTVVDNQGVRAVAFNATNSTSLKSDFLTTADFTGNSDWSLETWVYNPSIGAEEQVVTWSNRGDENKNAAFLYGTAPNWGAFAGWGAGDIGYLNATPPAGGVWHQVTITYAGGANSLLKVYVDGNLNVQGNKSLAIHGVDDGQAMPIILGASTGDNPNGLNANAETGWYTGSLSAVRFHGAALSSAQVYSNYLFEQPAYQGSLQVTITPAEAVTAGAQWRLSSDAAGVWRNSGDTVAVAASSAYTIEYKAVTGWQRLADQTVSVNVGQAVVQTASFQRQGAPFIYVVHEDMGQQAKVEAFLRDTYGQNADIRWFDTDTRFDYFTTKNRNINTALQAELQAADLIIMSRNTAEGEYASNKAEGDMWNAITKPILVHSAPLARSAFWNWYNIDKTASASVQDLDVVAGGDSLFNGVTVNGGKVRMFNVPTSLDLLDVTASGVVTAGGRPVIQRWIGTESGYYTNSPRAPKGPRLLWATPGGGDFITALAPAGLQMYRNALTQYAPIPYVNAQPLNFGAVKTSGGAVSKTTVITNQSATDLTISAGALTGNSEFSIKSILFNGTAVNMSTPVTLSKAAGDTLAITVEFTPTATEAKRVGQIVLTTNDPRYATTTINLEAAVTSFASESLNGNANPLNHVRWDGNKASVVATGGDIWNNADQCYFAYKKLSGDGEIIAKVDYLDSRQGSGDWTKAGIDMRETPTGPAKRVFIGFVTGGSPGTQVVYRNDTAGGCADQTNRDGQKPPYWLRLRRVGNVITPAYSEDGVSWTSRDARTTTMGPDIYVGLALTSNNGFGGPIRADYSNISITGNVSSVPVLGLAPSTVAVAPSPVAFGTVPVGPGTQTRILKISNTASPFVNARTIEVAGVTKTTGDVFSVGQMQLNGASVSLPVSLLPGGGSTLEIPILVDTTQAGTFTGMVVLLVDGVERGVELRATVSEPTTYTNPVTDGLTFALDASKLTGLKPGDKVASWADGSGNGNEAIMAEPSRRPIYYANASNGQPAVRFDGGDDYLNTGAIAANWPAAEVTVFSVSRAQVENASLFMQVPDVTSNRFQIHMPWDGNVYWDFGSDGTPGRLSVATGGLPTPVTSFNVWAFTSSPLLPGQTIYQNNKKVASNGSADVLNPTNSSLRIGNTAGGGEALNGDIAELLIYNRTLTAEESNAVGFYLQSKYGTPYGYQNPTPGPQIVANPVSSAFGSLGSGDPAKSVTFTIQNVGNGDPLNIASVESSSPAFEITSAVYTDPSVQTALPAPYAASLEGDLTASLAVTVAFNPAGKAASGYAGVVTVTSNDPAKPALELPLTALVTAAPVGAGLMIHLDASKIDPTNTDMVVEPGDGTQRVRRWPDLSPTGRTASQTDPQRMPLLIANAVNGQPAVRFDGQNEGGDFVSYSRITGRTFIMVMKETINAEAEPRKTFIGDSSSADFHRGPRHQMVDRPNSWSAGQVRDGDCWLNGKWIDCTAVETPVQYSVLTFRTLSNSVTDQLARDRTYGDRFWAGDVAEFLVYDRALTPAELNTIGMYLQAKYFPGQNYFVPTVPEGGLWAEPQTVKIVPTQGQAVQYSTIKVKHVGASGTTQVTSIDTSAQGAFTLTDAELNGVSVDAPYAVALTGDDELVIRVALDPAAVGIYKGQLTINSDDAARPACVVDLRADVVGLPVKNGLSLFLDASRIDKADPFQVTNRGGKNFVSVWPDLSGTNRMAVSNTPDQQPMLVDNVLNGQPVVRLDGVSNNNGDQMRWWPDNRNVRTVFMVMKENPAANDGVNKHILTGSDSYDFHRSDVTTNGRPPTLSPVNNVKVPLAAAINGTTVTLTETPPPTDLKILSITMPSDVIAGGIGRDRQITDRNFGGDYAEILIYDRVLTKWENNAVGYYLKTKYNLTNATYTEPTAPPANVPAIEVTPSVLDLGTMATEAFVQSGVVTIRNAGPSDTMLELSSLDFTKMGQFNVTEVLLNGVTPLSAPYAATLSSAAADYVEVHVTFDPSTVVAGSHGGWFLALSNDPAKADVPVGVSATVAGKDATAWRSQDVGNPALKGGFEQLSDGAFRLVAAGSDIWNNKDEMQFAYKGLYGDGSITARVRAMNLTQWNDWAKCGVMIRATLDGGSAYGGNLKAGGDGAGVTFQRRYVADQGSSGNGPGNLGRPMWLRLVRKGNVLSAYQSLNGTDWTQTFAPQTIAMPRTVYVGLGFTSHESAKYGEAIIDNVTLTGGIFDYTPADITADPINVANYPYRVRVTTTGFSGLPVEKREVRVKLGPATVADFTSSTFTSPTDGADLRFVAADKTTPLPFKIETWNPTGESTVWVRVNEITDADSHFYAIWGEDNPTTPTYNDISWAYSPVTADGLLSYTRVITDGQTLMADAAGVSTTTLAGSTAQLGGSSSTQHVLYKWEVVSTPADPQASVTFATPKAATTNANFSNTVLGGYVLKLTVSDDFNTPSVSTVTQTVVNDTPVVSVGANIYANAGAPIQLNGSMTDVCPGNAVATWSLVGPGSWTFVEGTANSLNPKVQFPDANGVYTVRLTVNDGLAAPVFDELTVYVAASNGVIYVDQAMTTNTLTGFDWANACQSIGQGLQMASKTGATQVWVAAGLYNESVTVPTGVQLMGGFAGTESSLAERNLKANQTTINGAGAAHVVTLNNVKNVRVDGFTITGGSAFASGEGSKGAGVYANLVDSTNVIANCEISGNRADVDGGGIYLYASSPFIVNSVIAGNEADNGAAVFCRMLSEPTITNCTIADNRVMTKGAVGLMEWSAPILTNNIIAGNPNVAVNEVSANSAAALVNNLFWSNGTADYYDFGAAQPNTTGTAVNSLPGAVGNVFGDPLFTEGATGTWTAAPVYNSTDKVTTLSNVAAAFTPGALVGSFIETSTTIPMQAYVVDNTTTEVVVLGDVTGFTTAGAVYRFANYALTPGSAATDAGAAGAPTEDIVGVTRPVNGANDIGAYELQKSEDIVLLGSLDFGKQVAGAGPTTPARTVVVKNNGTAQVAITHIALSGLNAAEFAISAGGTTGILAVGATQEVSVVFNPTLVQSNVAVFEVETSNTANTLPVTGLGTPVAPTNLDLAAASDTGASNTDNLTKLSVVTISATAPAGTDVRLYDGADLVLTDTAENFAAGVTLDFNTSLTTVAVEGTHNLTAVTYNADVNVESQPSAPLQIVVDLTVPQTYGVNLAAADDTGVSNSDRITKKASNLTIYGAADYSNPATEVTLTDGATLLTSGTALQFASGLKVNLGTEGIHVVTAVATDLAGNASVPAAIDIEVDMTKPEVATNAALTASPVHGSTVEFGVEFTQDVVTFNNPLTDVTVNATNGLQYSSVAIAPASQSEYVVTVDGITSSGQLTMTVNPSSAMDIAGNYNSLAKISDTVTVDNNLPVMLAEPAWTAGTTNTVAWEPMPGATSYTLVRALDANQASPVSVVLPATATTHTLTGLTDGVKYYYFVAAYLDGATTITAWSKPVFSTQDATNPATTVKINGGAVYTKSAAVSVTLDANDAQGPVTNSGVFEMRYNQGSGWSAWKPFNASQPYLFEGADGVKALEAEVRDRALNVSAVATTSIILDRVAPTGTVTPVELGPVYGTSATYVVTFTEPVTGFETAAGSLSLTATALPNTDPITYTGVAITAQSATTYTVTVSGIAGSGHLMLSVPTGLAADVAGNGNAAFGPSAGVLIDNSVPTMVAEPLWTPSNTNLVEWLVLFNTTTYTVQVADNKDFNSATEVGVTSLTTSQNFTGLADGTTYWYRVQANKDGVLTGWSAATSSTQDATLPTGSIQIGDGSTTYTMINQVQLTLSATDPTPGAGKLASGVKDMRFSDDAGATWSAWETYATSRAWTFSAAMDGVRTIIVEFRDNAGNKQSASASITLDLGRPAVVSTKPALLGPTNADSINVAVGFSEAVQGLNSASDVTMELKGVTVGTFAFAGLTTNTYNTTYTVTLGGIAGDGTFTLTVKENAAADTVGNLNTSGTACAVVTIDNTAPVLGPLTGTKVVGSANFVIRWPVVKDPSGINPYIYEIATDENFTNIVKQGTQAGVTLLYAGTEGVLYWVRVRAEDKAGNLSPWATDWVLYDNTAPTVASITPLTAGPTSNTAEFLVTFNEPVTGFQDLADVVTTSTGTVAITATTITALSQTEYAVTLSGLTGAGGVAISVPAAAAKNLANLDNVAFGPSAFITVAEFVAPVLTDEPQWSTTPNTIAWTTTTFATAYVAESATNAAFTEGVTDTTVTVLTAAFSNLTDGQTYWYRVKATDGVVETGWSNVTSTTINASMPSVTITSTASDPTSLTAIPITIAFSEPVTGFTASDIVTAGATVADFTAVSETTYTAVLNVTLMLDGLVTADIAAGVANDLAGNPNTAAAQFKINYKHYVEPTNPTVVLTSPATVTNVSPIPVTATFDQDVTGFEAADLVVVNGTVANFTAVSAKVYTFDVTPAAEGEVTVNVPADAVTSTGGKGNVASNLLSVLYDTTAPTVAITSTTSDPTSLTVIPITVTFSEVVTGFTADDIVTSNATVANFVADADGKIYTANLNVTLTADGVVTANVEGAVAVDLAGNPNTTATQFTRNFVLVIPPKAPQPVITTTASNPTSVSPIPVTVTFDLAVTGFEAGDVVVTNGAVSNFTAVSATVYTFDVTPQAAGDVTINVPAGAALSTENAASLAAAPLTVVYSPVVTPLTVVLSTNVTTTSARSIPVTATFSEAVTGFDVVDLVVQGATVANFTAGANNTYTFDLQVTLTADGPVTVQVPAGVCVSAQNAPNTVSNLLSIGYVYDINTIPLPAPTGVTATDGVYTYKTRVVWAAVEGAGFYKVYRTMEVTTGTAPLEEVTGWISGLSIDDQTAEPGVKYLYQVRAASTEQGGRQSELSVADVGWIATAPVPTTAWYKIQYANCTLAADSTSVSLDFTGTNDKSTVKIQSLPKGKPANASDVPGKVAYRELAKLDSVTVDGNMKSFYSDVDIESFEGIGPTSTIKSLTTKNANIAFISAAQLGTVKIDVSKHSTGAFPEYPSTSIYTTGDIPVGGKALTASVQLTGTILADLDMEQTLSYAKSATKKYTLKVNGVKEYRISLGGIGPVLRVVNDVTGMQPAEPFPMGSSVRALKIGTIAVSGSSIVPDVIEGQIQKITTTSGYFQVTNTGGLPSPVKVSYVVVAGNIRVPQIVSSDTLKLLQASPKVLSKVPYGGQIGVAGQTGYPQMTVLAPNIGTIAGKGGVVSGIFIAGYNKVDLPSGPHYSPNHTGSIKKIDATKTGQLWGEAYLNPSLAAKIVFVPKGGSVNFVVNPVE